MNGLLEIIKHLQEEALKSRSQPIKIFVSSTFMDLKKERQVVKSTINLCGCLPRLAEDADMQPGRNLGDQISYWLRDIDILVLLIAERYGELSASQVSWTETEVRKAVDQQITVFPYLVTKKIPFGMELDPDKRDRLKRFTEYLKHIPNQQPPQRTKNTNELAVRVARDISGFQSDRRITNIMNRLLLVMQKENEEEANIRQQREQESYFDSFVG